MAKKKSKKTEEVIEILEEDIPPKDSGKSWSEEIEMAGQDVMKFIRNIWTEANVRRIIVRNDAGDTLLNLPVGLGVFGVIFPYLLVPTAIVAVIGLANKCTVTVERRATEEEEVSA